MARMKKEFQSPKKYSRLPPSELSVIINKLTGQRMAALRKASNMPMSVVGELLFGVTGQQVSRYERGLSDVPASALQNFILSQWITPNDFWVPIMRTIVWWEEAGQGRGIKLEDVHLGMEEYLV